PRGSEEARAELLGDAGGSGAPDSGPGGPGGRAASAARASGGVGHAGGPGGRGTQGAAAPGARAPWRDPAAPSVRPDTGGRRLAGAFAPYLIVISVFSVAQLWAPVKEFLSSTDIAVPWPGLDGML